MECACIEVDYDGASELLSDTTPTARKAHKCCECYRIIPVGEQYRRESLAGDGTIDTYKTCLDCISVRNEFFCSWYYGMVWDDLACYIGDSDGDISESAIASLTPAARERVCRMIESCWEE